MIKCQKVVKYACHNFLAGKKWRLQIVSFTTEEIFVLKVSKDKKKKERGRFPDDLMRVVRQKKVCL